ncbi:MAG: carboxy terminal-processing peptidase [Chitinophagaceae bacterium]|nr:carboxy terminal-processing peptidase [Chitinophagaceae bacterium]MCA6455955.1 carboxy terminal-processing peptidase [Chitinophagaceae bacterium]MCA6459212.1 carboxy terminal-processing peptidase [Chitinophagaceae bacterium]MCA6464582.1 carboxy terminal-processing peptidase [Chitinophagaceae bacterium]MEA3426034.1 carboxy terminal-processing peptidase [Bacteroidota bacterium]
MKSRKGLLLVAIVLFGGLFFAFRTSGIGSKDILVTQKQRLLNAVGSILEQQHYSPKNINDDFSRQVFKKYLEDLDGDKSHFLQSDIAALKKYENSIDDEIHETAPIQFAPAVSAVYDQRIKDVMGIYREILSQPFSFTADETVELNGDKLNYAATEAERKERWRKKLKYYTLERYADLLAQREKNKGQKDFVVKADSTLERESREKVLKIMNETYERIQKTFKEEERFNSFINVITNQMDPHSDYFPPVEKRSFDENMSGKFYGIGATLQKDDYGIKIAAVVTGGAAWKSGEIVVNDVITKVAQGKEEPVDVTGYETTDAVKLIRGNKGTEVRLTIKKQDGSIKVVSMIREEVVVDERYARSAVIQNGNDKIGYIFLPDFYSDFEDASGHHCSEDVAEEVKKLKAENVKGIVIDIRSNGGGSLYEVVKMVGLFIKSGPVVQVKERSGRVDQNTWRDNDESVLYDGPLAVMVNEFSASASEIFAGAIQDYKRGVIIGSTSTYGKGTVQRQVPFGNRNDLFSGRTDMGAMTLTFQKFYRINGGSTQLKGVTPDIVLPDALEYYKGREKDNPGALPYDEIPKLNYQTWSSDFGLESLAKKENERIQSNPSLNLLKSNLQWLAKNSELPVDLNLEKYRNRQQQVMSTVNQNNALLKAKQELNVSALAADKDKFYNNPDPSKGERYQAWLKFLKTDMHIDESVKIVSQMAHSQVQMVAK